MKNESTELRGQPNAHLTHQDRKLQSQPIIVDNISKCISKESESKFFR